MTTASQSLDEVVGHVKSGDRIWIHPGYATPVPLINALLKRRDELEDIEIFHILTFGEADTVNDRELRGVVSRA